MNATPTAELARLRWRCRRGMRELDLLLTAYLDAGYVQADAAEKRAFGQLLTLPDPELAAYLLHGQRPVSGDLAHVVERILGRAAP